MSADKYTKKQIEAAEWYKSRKGKYPPGYTAPKSAKEQLIEAQSRRKLDAIERVDSPGGSTKIDSVMAGYPVSALAKQKEDKSGSVLNLLRQRDYTLGNIESGHGTRVDSTVLQYLDEEIMNALGEQYKKSSLKSPPNPKTKAKTKDKEPVKLPFLWKNQLNNARRAVENDKSEKTTIKSYLNERKWSNEQIIAATIRDQAGE